MPDRIVRVKADGQEPWADIRVPASVEPLLSLLGSGNVRAVGVDDKDRVRYVEVETVGAYYEIHLEDAAD